MRLDAMRSGVLVVGLALVLAGCVPSPESGTTLPASEPTPSVQPPNTAEPSPTSSELPSATPAETTTAEVEETAMESCYLFLVESGLQLGGQPVEQEVTYLGMDGIVQASREMSNELILQLGQQEADPTALFAMLGQAEFPVPVEAPTPGPGTPVVVSEGWGPTLVIEVGRCDGSTNRWIGDPAEVPATLTSLVAEVHALRAAVMWNEPRPGAMYMRAEYLDTDTAHQLRAAERMIDLTSSQVEANPPLSTALHNVRRLIEVPEGFDQYAGIPVALSWGTRLYVTYAQTAYQVRHILAEVE